MKSFIRITRHPYEEPHHLNLVIEASNGHMQGSLEFYDNADTLSEIADALEVFPRDDKDQYLWELGSENPEDNFAFYFRLHIFLTNSRGHSAIQIRLNNNQELPDREMSEFCIPAVPADINRLGTLFREFSKLKKTALEWTVTDGEVR